MARQARHNLAYARNDEFYWDEYAREKAGLGANVAIGAEWKNEEIFLALLERFSSRDSVALEIGCGGGRITQPAVSLFRHVYAADVSGRMLGECRDRVPQSNVSFHKIDGFTLKEFGDGTIDCIYSHDVFVHFSSLQVLPYLAEVKRVLKPAGLAIISFYDFLAHFDLFRQMSERFWNQRRLPPHMRVHFLSEALLLKMVGELGMEVVQIEKSNFLIAVIRR